MHRLIYKEHDIRIGTMKWITNQLREKEFKKLIGNKDTVQCEKRNRRDSLK